MGHVPSNENRADDHSELVLLDYGRGCLEAQPGSIEVVSLTIDIKVGEWATIIFMQEHSSGSRESGSTSPANVDLTSPLLDNMHTDRIKARRRTSGSKH